MNKKIEKFLKAWDKMLASANDIEEFEWDFHVKITSNDAFITERQKTINGINKSFEENGMKWTSNN